MASSSPDVNLTRAKEFGKYSKAKEPTNGKPHEKSRILAAEEVEINRICAGCGKHMRKVKPNFVCSCKNTIHCSKDCLKSSGHKCKEPSNQNQKLTSQEQAKEVLAACRERYFVDRIEEQAKEVLAACRERYFVDRIANQGPSSDKITWLLKVTRGEHQRILKYAERGNPVASYVVGRAYAARQFDRKDDFAIPFKYKALSVAETSEMALKWLKVAAEGGIPEAMFLLFTTTISVEGLRVDHRVGYDWLVKAHATGTMDYLIHLLEVPMFCILAYDFTILYNQIVANVKILHSQSLGALLMATRYRELEAWDGKTAMGEPFYGHAIFKLITESIGEVENVESKPSFIDGEEKAIVVISARPGYCDFVDKSNSFVREENNLKFMQGLKERNSLDYQLVDQTSNEDGRTSYLFSCKHNVLNMDEEKAKEVKYDKIKGAIIVKGAIIEPIEDIMKSYTVAGECEPCVQEAKQRLRAVNLGQFSISLFPLFDDFYAARYSNEDGVIIQDMFMGYTKSYMRQVLQCLMSNPADLHPLAVAEIARLFWPIIWFWGSVYRAVQDTCNKATLDAIYHSPAQNINFSTSENASAMAAFPETAAGESRIACGSEVCPRVDHEVKFNICKGCNVRRYCDAACQKEDWPKHKKFCTAAKKQK